MPERRARADLGIEAGGLCARTETRRWLGHRKMMTQKRSPEISLGWQERESKCVGVASTEEAKGMKVVLEGTKVGNLARKREMMERWRGEGGRSR